MYDRHSGDVVVTGHAKFHDDVHACSVPYNIHYNIHQIYCDEFYYLNVPGGVKPAHSKWTWYDPRWLMWYDSYAPQCDEIDSDPCIRTDLVDDTHTGILNAWLVSLWWKIQRYSIDRHGHDILFHRIAILCLIAFVCAVCCMLIRWRQNKVASSSECTKTFSNSECTESQTVKQGASGTAELDPLLSGSK